MDYEQLILVFTSIVYEALPFIVLGVVIAGLLEEFLPQQALANVLPRSRFVGILMGGLLGIVFPMCECGIIVVMRRLLRKGLPLSVCVAYMLAGPVINVVVLLSTYVAFNYPDEKYHIFGGPEGVVLIRAGIAYLVAVNAALLVEWQFQKHGNNLLAPVVLQGLRTSSQETQAASGKRTLLERTGNITETALNDFVDILAFLIIGAALASGGRAIVANIDAAEVIHEVPVLAILLMMGMAVLFCLCSEADAFVAANFQPMFTSTNVLFWPPASKIAFLVLGPMLDIKLYLMYTRVFRPRLIFTIILAVVTQVFVYTLALHYLTN
ncbi:MAG: permease [Gemmataceae bacterium]|nr:permease [Gemmataceae bacterium]MCI0737767.1 permease [Gemmataceae bacterium]